MAGRIRISRKASGELSHGASDDLQKEILEIIFARVPASYLVRFRNCLSRTWTNILNSPSFAQLHSRLAPPSEILLVCHNGYDLRKKEFELCHPVLRKWQRLVVPDEFSLLSKVSATTSHGVVCFSSQESLIVWNPLTNSLQFVKTDFPIVTISLLALEINLDGDCFLVAVTVRHRRHMLCVYDIKAKSWKHIILERFGWQVRTYSSTVAKSGYVYFLSTNGDAVIKYSFKDDDCTLIEFTESSIEKVINTRMVVNTHPPIVEFKMAPILTGAKDSLFMTALAVDPHGIGWICIWELLQCEGSWQMEEMPRVPLDMWNQFIRWSMVSMCTLTAFASQDKIYVHKRPKDNSKRLSEWGDLLAFDVCRKEWDWGPYFPGNLIQAISIQPRFDW